MDHVDTSAQPSRGTSWINLDGVTLLGSSEGITVVARRCSWNADELDASDSTASPNVIDRSTEVLHTCLRIRPHFVEHTDILTVDSKFVRTGDRRDRSLPGLRRNNVSGLRLDLLPRKWPVESVPIAISFQSHSNESPQAE